MALEAVFKNQNIDLSSAPWTMHEFFAGSGLVAYGLKGMFAPVWANDISEQKAAVYEANFGYPCFKERACLGMVACLRRNARTPKTPDIGKCSRITFHK